MNLVITTYLDRELDAVKAHADKVVSAAVGAAAGRISEEATPASTIATADGFRVQGGLSVLDGAEVDLQGTERLTTVTVTVPWSTADAASGAKLLAANRFAQVLTTEVRAAA